MPTSVPEGIPDPAVFARMLGEQLRAMGYAGGPPVPAAERVAVPQLRTPAYREQCVVLVDAINAINMALVKPSLEEALPSLEEAKTVLSKRMTQLQLADSNPGFWANLEKAKLLEGLQPGSAEERALAMSAASPRGEPVIKKRKQEDQPFRKRGEDDSRTSSRSKTGELCLEISSGVEVLRARASDVSVQASTVLPTSSSNSSSRSPGSRAWEDLVKELSQQLCAVITAPAQATPSETARTSQPTQLPPSETTFRAVIPARRTWQDPLPDQRQFVSEEVERLLQSRAIETCEPTDVAVSSPIFVVEGAPHDARSPLSEEEKEALGLLLKKLTDGDTKREVQRRLAEVVVETDAWSVALGDSCLPAGRSDVAQWTRSQPNISGPPAFFSGPRLINWGQLGKVVGAESHGRLQEAVRAAKASSTWKQYEAIWNKFTAWNGGISAESVVAYTLSNGLSKAQIAQLSAAFSMFNGSVFSPVCRLALKGAGGAKPVKHHNPLTSAHLAVVAKDAESAKDVRPHLAALLAFAACLRISEVAALDVSDCRGANGSTLEIMIRKSKRDQGSSGASVFVCLDSSPVLRGLLLSHIDGRISGPLFRRSRNSAGVSVKYLSRLVVGLFDRLGIDCTAHGCRAGAAMALLEEGRELHQVKRAGRWKSDAGLESYVSRTVATMGGSAKAV